MHHIHIGGFQLFPIKILVIKLSKVRQVTPHQHHIAIIKVTYTVAYKLCAAAILNINKFKLVMVMPAVINIGRYIPPCTKRLCQPRSYR